MLPISSGTQVRRPSAPAVALTHLPDRTVRTAVRPAAVDTFSAAPVRNRIALSSPAVATPVPAKDVWSSDDAALQAVSEDRPFRTLSPAQQGLFGAAGEKAYLALSDKQRQLVLLLTERLMANGIDLQGMLLKEAGEPTRPNRILFNPASPGMDRFVDQLQGGTKDGRFDTDKVFPLFHWGMSELGFREERRKFSMQIGVGPNGAFVDVDRFNPFTDWKAWLGHFAEIVIPGKPSADTIATAIAG